MNVSTFSSFFELFAAINLAYAGAEIFRIAFDRVTDEVNISIAQRIVLLRSAGNFIQDESGLQEAYNDLSLMERMAHEEQLYDRFAKNFRPAFFVTSLFCIAVLLIIGFDTLFESKSSEWVFLSLIDLIIVFNIFLFVQSYRQHLDKEVNIEGLLLIFGTLIALGLVYINLNLPYWEISDPRTIRTILFISLLVPVSPFLLHAIKAFPYRRRRRSVISDILGRRSKLTTIDLKGLGDLLKDD